MADSSPAPRRHLLRCRRITAGIAGTLSRCRGWHRSTWAFVGLVAGVLVLCNLPAELEYTVDLDYEGQLGPEFRLRVHFVHGWPLSYLQRNTSIPADAVNRRYIPTTPWRVWEGVQEFRPTYLIGDLLAAIFCLLIAGVAFEKWRAQRQRLLQLHLRDCFALISIVALVAGWIAYQRSQFEQEQQTLDAMHRMDTRQGYDVVSYVALKKCGPFWLRQLLGEHWPPFFDRVFTIDLRCSGLGYLHHFAQLESVQLMDVVTNEQLRALESVPNLQALNMTLVNLVDSAPKNSDAATDDSDDSEANHRESLRIPLLPGLRGLALNEIKFRGDGLSQLTRLEVLSVYETDLDDTGLVHLRNCPHLRKLDLTGPGITDNGLVNLRGLAQLNELNLFQTQVTDAGLVHLRGLSQLRSLNLGGTHVTDVGYPGLTNLRKLTQLKELYLFDTAIHSVDAQELQKALPNCTIFFR